MTCFMKRLIVITIALFALFASAQDSLSISEPFFIPQGRWGLHIDNNPYTWAWTHISHDDFMDASSLGLLNLGLGAEYTYRDNRSLRLMAHAGLIGHNDFSIGESLGPSQPRRIVEQITVDFQHFWYYKRLYFGLGPSFEWRNTSYSCERYEDYLIENEGSQKNIDKAIATYEKFGSRGFNQRHLSLGVKATLAFRVFPGWYVGLEYAPRVVCHSQLTYKNDSDDEHEPIVSEPAIGTAAGHFDHQLSIVLGCCINLTKRNP